MNVVVFITAKDIEEAKKIARGLLEKKLAACCNLIDGVKSLFWWEGKIDEALETLIIVKTQKRKMKEIIQTVKLLHSYQVPEVIALPVVDGYEPYLKWVKESLA